MSDQYQQTAPAAGAQMADLVSIVRAEPAKYVEYAWGDHIEGTKEQLQALGLGVGLAFPGEPGGPRRALRVRDPRGGRAAQLSITNAYTPYGRYSVRLPFPDWPAMPEERWTAAAPGIKKRKWSDFDEYRGSAEDLVAAGLVRADLMPGAANMQKTSVKIQADGTVLWGRASWYMLGPGCRQITRASASSYHMRVRVSEEEEKHRVDAASVARREWENKVRALPRPPRLSDPLLQPRPPLEEQRKRELIASLKKWEEVECVKQRGPRAGARIYQFPGCE